MTIRWNGNIHGQYILPKAPRWETHDVEVKPFDAAEANAGGLDRGPMSPQASLRPTGDARMVSRWPGEGSLAIQSVRLLNAEEKEQAVFEPDCELRVRMKFLAKAAGSILGDEAMHWAVLRQALGENPVPEAFVA